jgi:hypothetical protein
MRPRCDDNDGPCASYVPSSDYSDLVQYSDISESLRDLIAPPSRLNGVMHKELRNQNVQIKMQVVIHVCA